MDLLLTLFLIVLLCCHYSLLLNKLTKAVDASETNSRLFGTPITPYPSDDIDYSMLMTLWTRTFLGLTARQHGRKGRKIWRYLRRNHYALYQTLLPLR